MASGPRATKGKKMAMKFLNKMGTKEKFSKHIPGMGQPSEEGPPSIPVTTWLLIQLHSLSSLCE